jgi:hypothetical protein
MPDVLPERRKAEKVEKMIVKQHKHFDGQVFWFTYEPALPVKK